MQQTFKPVDAPYVPKDLIWYDSETSWQRLVNQRLNGDIETYTENIISTFMKSFQTMKLENQCRIEVSLT
ncbi:hypothetical protein [Winogradskyella sp.]|uniref:hypothetical protein n=1 Tax=Winogradskyella sp. TaxID=1883156 RepID=UPI003AB25236